MFKFCNGFSTVAIKDRDLILTIHPYCNPNQPVEGVTLSCHIKIKVDELGANAIVFVVNR